MTYNLGEIPLYFITAMAGGALGALIATKKGSKFSLAAGVFNMAIGIIFSGAVAEKLLSDGYPLYASAVGIVVGIMSGHIIDAVLELAPGLSKFIVKGAASKLVDKEFEDTEDKGDKG